LILKIDFLRYSVKDFLLDESFQRWVRRQGADTRGEFDNWLEEHPEKRDIIEQARTIMLQMKSHFEADTSQNAIEEIWSRIQNTIDNTLIKQEY
jgi:transmembrane sensor